jgi:hypothetical protein
VGIVDVVGRLVVGINIVYIIRVQGLNMTTVNVVDCPMLRLDKIAHRTVVRVIWCFSSKSFTMVESWLLMVVPEMKRGHVVTPLVRTVLRLNGDNVEDMIKPSTGASLTV